jgi:hypothetical protein
MRDLFANSNEEFHFYFVNNPEANRYTEIGLVDREWLRKNMPKTEPEIPEHDDGITIVFTNNKGAQRFPMTPWITAHRIGHAFSRYSFKSLIMEPQLRTYEEAFNNIINTTKIILEDAYNVARFPSTRMELTRGDRRHQLIFKNFYQHVGTFRSAREGMIRDWFEVMNELIAQYLVTTKKIYFNELPLAITRRGPFLIKQNPSEEKELLNTLARDLNNYYLYDMFNTSYGKIFIM